MLWWDHKGERMYVCIIYPWSQHLNNEGLLGIPEQVSSHQHEILAWAAIKYHFLEIHRILPYVNEENCRSQKHVSSNENILTEVNVTPPQHEQWTNKCPSIKIQNDNLDQETKFIKKLVTIHMLNLS